MKSSSGLRALVCSLAVSPTERRVAAAALVALTRQRQRALSFVVPWAAWLPFALRSRDSKLTLWMLLAMALAGRRKVCSAPEALHAALAATQAFRDAQARVLQGSISPLARGIDYASVLSHWRQQPPRRLVIFHHYDRRGRLPQSWLQALLSMQRAGWQVLVSTSDLNSEWLAQLEAQGVRVALRRNIGLCLGAYKDLVTLFQGDPQLAAGLQSLVLCNDSTLPVLPDDRLLAQLARWDADAASAEQPVLAGLTDSAQRGLYHLQSFLLHANAALLQHPAWRRFWLEFSLQGSKDDLINNGEIGLSQALLAAGVALRPAYPLVQGLLEDAAMAEELQRYGIWQPRHVNQSLFAWQSLLARGFPLVKKHVLFDLLEQQGQTMALASLAQWIPADRRPLLAADLQELFVSRYACSTPEPG